MSKYLSFRHLLIFASLILAIVFAYMPGQNGQFEQSKPETTDLTNTLETATGTNKTVNHSAVPANFPNTAKVINSKHEISSQAKARKIPDFKPMISVTNYQQNVLSADQKQQLLDEMKEADERTAITISEYDMNLSDLEKRQELEAKFSEDNKAYQIIALKLVKDQIAREKLALQQN